MMIHVPLAIRLVCMPTPKPKPWKSGITENIRSPSIVKPAFVATCAASAFILRFVSSIPFEVPVVPPENRITAVSSFFGNVAGSSLIFLPPAMKSAQSITSLLSFGNGAGFFFKVRG